METFFANTSILWAFKMANPLIGVSYSDMWRYCALWLFGGVYIDDDSSIGNLFDDIITTNDSLILTNERSVYTDCYQSYFYLSTQYLERQYCSNNDQLHERLSDLYSGRNIVNWAIFSAPRNEIIYRALKNIVNIFKLEYLGRSVLSLTPNHYRYHRIFCTTGPAFLTATIREFTLQNEYDSLLHNLTEEGLGFNEYKKHLPRMSGDFDFHKYGGFRKIEDNRVAKGSHYMVKMNSLHLNLLHSYANISKTSLETRFVVAQQPYDVFPTLMLSAEYAVENGEHYELNEENLKHYAHWAHKHRRENVCLPTDAVYTALFDATGNKILEGNKNAFYADSLSTTDNNILHQNNNTFPSYRPWNNSNYYQILKGQLILYPDFCSFIASYLIAVEFNAPLHIDFINQTIIDRLFANTTTLKFNNFIQQNIRDDINLIHTTHNKSNLNNIHSLSKAENIYTIEDIELIKKLSSISRQSLNKRILSGDGKEFFLIYDCKRYSFPNFDTYEALNYTLSNLTIIPIEHLQALPFGCTLLPLDHR